MNFVFSCLSDVKEESEHTHMYIHTHIKELLTLHVNTLHVPVFLHTSSQQLRIAPDEKI